MECGRKGRTEGVVSVLLNKSQDVIMKEKIGDGIGAAVGGSSGLDWRLIISGALEGGLQLLVVQVEALEKHAELGLQ